MTKEQEGRLLGNQALIMRALQVLLAVAGKEFMRSELEIRARDVETFIAGERS